VTAAALTRELAALLGPEGVREGDATRPYLRDSTEMQGLAGRPDAVALPASVEQVQALVAWCYERGVPMVPRGGGTGFSGGAVAVEGGLVLSLERLDRVRSFDPELWRMEVEAGCAPPACSGWRGRAGSPSRLTPAPASSR
jgi:FAD/FMN-containing dehydrogenase